MAFWNIIVDLLQEAPQFLATLLKSGTDYRFNRMEKIGLVDLTKVEGKTFETKVIF